jgi:hypothetical protein
MRNDEVNRKPMIVAKGWIEAVAVMPATATNKVATVADQNPSRRTYLLSVEWNVDTNHSSICNPRFSYNFSAFIVGLVVVVR